MIRAGLTDPRYSDPRPSLNQLGLVSGVHTTTVSRMVHGKGVPDPDNVARVAAALRRPVVEVSEWVRQARTEDQPYTPPSEVNLLSRREQDAINELIRAMAQSRKGVVGNAEHPAPTKSVPTGTTEPAGTEPEQDGLPSLPPETDALHALPGGTMPTSVDLPRAPARKRSSRRTGTHTRPGNEGRTT